MNLSLISFDGHAINDGTNYAAVMPEQNGAAFPQARATFLARADNWPVYAGKQVGEMSLPVTVVIKSGGSMDQLMGWLDLLGGEKVLLAQDETTKQWYLNATVVRIVREGPVAVTIMLGVADPLWRSNTENSSTWTITGSGQQKTITPSGNKATNPKLEITPTTAGGSGFAYRRWIMVRNAANKTLVDYPFNVCGTVLNTASLVANTSKSNQINNGAGITAGATTIDIDTPVGGGLPASGMGYVDTEQISWTANSGTQLTGVTRGINGTTAATHADNAVIKWSQVQADGDDIRVYMNGVEIPRWLSGMNSASTKIWMVGNWKPKVSMTGPSVSNGALSSITLLNTTGNIAALKNLAKWGGKTITLYVDSEAISIANASINTATRKITGTFTRGAKGTSAASHSAGASWYWLEHEVYLYYGNSTMSAPDQDETKKPMLNLSTSTNTSWVYAEFSDAAGLRSARWAGEVLATDNRIDTEYKSDIYRGSRLADADPATEMGMSLQAFRSGSIWKAEQGAVGWTLYHPCGVTTITASGEKYRSTGLWPTAALRKSADGIKWSNVWSDAAPSSAASWEALASHSSVSLSGTYNWLRFLLTGTQPATANAQANYSLTDVTLTLDSNYTPVSSMAAEESCYHMQATISNTTSGDAIQLNVAVPLNSTFVVDCEARSVTMPDGSNGMGCITWSSKRAQWLPLAAGANVLQFDDTGTAGVSIVVKWRDRNT